MAFPTLRSAIATAALVACCACTKQPDVAPVAIATQASPTAPSAKAEVSKPKPIPLNAFQKGFMEIVYEFAQLYPQAENELKKSALVTARFKKFETLKGNPRQIKDWFGTVRELKTTGDGHAFITLELYPGLTFSTWNNDFSDFQDKSLIPQSSPIFAKLSEMQPGNVVKFSGRLKHAKNMTESGKMTEPDFLFIFSDINKVTQQ